MRVLMMLSSISMGGAERNVVSVLPHIRDTGVDVILGTLNTRRDSPLARDFDASGIRRVDLRAKRMTDPAAVQRLRRVIRDEQIDIVHAEDQDASIYAALARRTTGVPALMTRHVMVEPGDTLKEAMRARLLLLAARFGMDQLVAVSEAVRRHFAEQAHIPLSRITTIYNGIRIGDYQTREQRMSKRAEMGWQPGRPIIIMVAVLRRGKGHEVLFDAIPQITAAVPDAQIKLVGDGELAESLHQKAQPYGPAVEFLGQRMDVPALLGASDILVLPSWSEALPTVLIEAGAASLPCVATDVGGASEIVQDGDTGYLVPPGDHGALGSRLVELLQDQETARAMGDRAYARVNSTFSLAQQAQQTVTLYEQVLHERKRISS